MEPREPSLLKAKTISGETGLEDVKIREAAASSGFSNRATAWDCIAGQPDCLNEVADFLKQLDEQSDLRAAATL